MKRFVDFLLLVLAIVVSLLAAGCGAASTGGGTAQLTVSAPAGADVLAPGVWKCPQDLTGASFVGSTEDRTYYLPDCHQVEIIESENRICFATSEAARDYGYTPCGRCP